LYLSILILAAALRVYGLDVQSLWNDEARSVQTAQNILNRGFDSGLFNSHGPLYFYILAYLLPNLATESVLRAPSALLGVCLVILAYFLGRKAIGSAEGLVAAGMVAVSPFAIWYSQEVRFVGLFILFSGLSILLTLRFAETGTLRDLALYVSTTLIMLFSFVAGIFLLPAQTLWFVFVKRNRATLGKWILGQFLIAILFVPWLDRAYHIGLNPFLTSQEKTFSATSLKTGRERPTNFVHVGYPLYAFSVGYSLGPSIRELQESPSIDTVTKNLNVVIPAVLFIGLLAAGGLAKSFATSKHRATLLVLCLLCPILGAYAMSSMTQIAYNVRYTASAFPAYMVFLASGVTWLWQRTRLRWFAIGGVSAVILLSLGNYYANPRYAKEDSKGAAAIISRLRRPDEPLIAGVRLHAFRFYYRSAFLDWREVTLNGAQPQRDQSEASMPERIWLVSNMKACFAVERRFDLPGFEILVFRTSQEGHRSDCRLQFRESLIKD
jgi:uncharacterized membrane protein